MVLESRIASEPKRRVVIAVIMACVLAASTAWAVWLSRSRGPVRASEMVPDRVRSFSLVRPAGWARKDVAPDGDLLLNHGAVFEDGSDHRLTALELEFDRPVPPWAALRELVTQVAGAKAELGDEVDSFRIGPFSGVSGATVGGGEWSLLAVLSVDGRHHLGLGLTRGSGVPDVTSFRRDELLLGAVVRSIQDSRFADRGQRLTLPFGLSIEVPPGLKAVGNPADGSARVLFHPVSNPGFFVVALTPIDLSAMPDSVGEPNGVPSRFGDAPMPEGLEHMLDVYQGAAPADRLMTWVWMKHFQSVGRLPRRDAAAEFAVHEQTGFELALPATSDAPTSRSLWGVTLDENHAVLLELTAEPSATRMVRQAAMVLVQTLTGSQEMPEMPAAEEEGDIAK